MSKTNTLQLFVSNINNDIKFTIKCENSITLLDLKVLISKELDTFPCLFRLIHKNRELSNVEQFLNDMPLTNEDMLFIMMKLNIDKEILLELKRRFNLNLNWSADIDLSEWYRVGVSNNNVIHLELPSLNLTGNIPREIENLTNLQTLSLYNNQLTGNIPQEIGKLTNLKWFSLSDNQLTGKIPVEIGNITNLQYIGLFKNQLTGKIPVEIGKLTNLRQLHLYSNQLTGKIPVEIGKLTNLQHLYLNNNNLSKDIPEAVKRLEVKINVFMFL